MTEHKFSLHSQPFIVTRNTMLIISALVARLIGNLLNTCSLGCLVRHSFCRLILCPPNSFFYLHSFFDGFTQTSLFNSRQLYTCMICTLRIIWKSRNELIFWMAKPSPIGNSQDSKPPRFSQTFCKIIGQGIKLPRQVQITSLYLFCVVHRRRNNMTGGATIVQILSIKFQVCQQNSDQASHSPFYLYSRKSWYFFMQVFWRRQKNVEYHSWTQSVKTPTSTWWYQAPPPLYPHT